MAAKRLNLPPVPSTVAYFPLSNAPLPTPAGWWRRPSSSPSLLARDDDDDGSDVHRCSCRRVVVVLVVMLVVVLLLSVVPSRCCCAATAAKPPTRSGRRHRHGHLHRRCRRNRIRCSYHRRPHIAAAFTAVVDAVIAPLPHRRCKFPQRSYRWLSPSPLLPPSLLPSPLHSLQPSLPPSVSVSPSPQQTTQFSGTAKKYRGISKTTNPSKLPV